MPPPYDALFLPPYSRKDPDMCPCEALCPFPHHHDPLQPLLMSYLPPPYSSGEPPQAESSDLLVPP